MSSSHHSPQVDHPNVRVPTVVAQRVAHVLDGLQSPNEIEFPAPVVSPQQDSMLPVDMPSSGVHHFAVVPDVGETVAWELEDMGLLDDLQEDQMQPLGGAVIGGGGARSNMFQHMNAMMETLMESNRQQPFKRKRVGSRGSTTVVAESRAGAGRQSPFAKHRWTLTFLDAVVEEEFLVFYNSYRMLGIVSCFLQTFVCVIGVAMYSGLSSLTIGLYMGVCTLWVGSGIAIIVLRRAMQEYEAATTERILSDQTVQQDASTKTFVTFQLPQEGGGAKNPFELLSVASLRGSGVMPHNATKTTPTTKLSRASLATQHSLLIAGDASRIPMRRNAQYHEYLNMIVLVTNFLFAIANFLGKGTCYNPKWNYEMELRGCRRAIQMDAVPLLLFTITTFTHPIRWVVFAAIYLLCSIMNMASRAAPPMIEIIPAYFWASVTVYGMEAIACIIASYLRETSARDAFEVHVQLYQRATEAARIRKHTERMVASQIPLAAARCVTARTPSGTSLQTREAALFCWSPVSVLCAITIHNFGSWSARRGSSEIVECLRRLTNVFDSLENIFSSTGVTPSKYPCIGDMYLLMHTPTLPDKASRREQQIALEHVVNSKTNKAMSAGGSVRLGWEDRAVSSLSGSVQRSNVLSERSCHTPAANSSSNSISCFDDHRYPQVSSVLRDMLLFALASLVRGTSSLSQYINLRAAPSEDRGVPALQLRAAVAIGFGGGIVNRMTKNHLATGPVVTDAMRLLNYPTTLSREAAADGSGTRVGHAALRIAAPLASSLGLRVAHSPPNALGPPIATGVRNVTLDELHSMLRDRSVAALQEPEHSLGGLGTPPPFRRRLSNFDRTTSTTIPESYVMPSAMSSGPQVSGASDITTSVTTPRTAFGVGYTTAAAISSMKDSACIAAALDRFSSQTFSGVCIETIHWGTRQYITPQPPVVSTQSKREQESQGTRRLKSYEGGCAATSSLTGDVCIAQNRSIPTTFEPPTESREDNRQNIDGKTSVEEEVHCSNAGETERGEEEPTDWRTVDTEVINSKFVMTIATNSSIQAAAEPAISATTISSPPTSIPSGVDDASSTTSTAATAPDRPQECVTSSSKNKPNKKHQKRSTTTGGKDGKDDTPPNDGGGQARMPPPHAPTGNAPSVLHPTLCAHQTNEGATVPDRKSRTARGPTTSFVADTSSSVGTATNGSSKHSLSEDYLPTHRVVVATTPQPAKEAHHPEQTTPPKVSGGDATTVREVMDKQGDHGDTAARRVQLEWSILTFTFVDKEVEAAYQAQVCDVTLESVVWGFVGELMSITSLIVLCFIDELTTMSYDAPLLWAMSGAIGALAVLTYLTLSNSGSGSGSGGQTILAQVDAPRILYILVQACFIVCVFTAPSGTIIGDSQLVWPAVNINMNFNRPLWARWYLQWALDIAVFGAFFVRTYFIFTIPTPSSMYTVTILLEGVLIFAALTYRLLVDAKQRNYFAASKRLEYLKEEIADDYRRLHDALELTIPEGIAGKLVTKARKRSECITVRQRIHPIWSTSFGTSTDETPFVVVELVTTEITSHLPPTPRSRYASSPTLADSRSDSDDDVSSTALAHIKAKMDMVTSLNALCKRGFEGRIQCMKATHNVVLFCATASSSSSSGSTQQKQNGNKDVKEKLTPDEQRASDVLSFAVRATRILRAQQQTASSVADNGVAAPHVKFRMVVGSGYLMGAVVGRVGVSFDYYGSSMARALKLLELLEWGSVGATDRLVFLHLLDKAMLSTSALLSIEPYVARHVGFTPFHYHLIRTEKL